MRAQQAKRGRTVEVLATRYYRIVPAESAPPIRQALESIAAKLHPDRQVTISGDVVLRLEKLTTALPHVSGQMVRIQSENKPDEVLATGLQKLSTSNPLGYGVVFVINVDQGVLAMEYDTTKCGPARLSTYLKKSSASYKYDFYPIVRKDVWDEFNDGEVTAFRVRVAMPESFEFAGEDTSLGTSLKSLAQAYSSPYINVELSVGHRKTSLGDDLKSAAGKLFAQSDVKWMKATVVGHDDEIDLSGYYLKDSEKIELVNLDPETSFSKRLDVVNGNLNSRLEEIIQLLAGEG